MIDIDTLIQTGQITRLSGTIAFILLSLGVWLGLILTTRLGVRIKTIPGFMYLKLHKNFNVLGLVFVIIHFSSLLANKQVGSFILSAMNPLNFRLETMALNLGSMAFYIMLLIAITAILRSKFKYWRAIHYLSFLSYFMFLGHAYLMSGPKLLYAISFIGFCVLFIYRLFTIYEKSKRIKFPFPRIYKAVVKKKNYLNDKTLLLTLGFVDNNIKFIFLPGQFINIKIGENVFRSYSVCSDYRNTWELSVVATVAHDGVGANYLKSLRVGDKVEFIGPSGRYILQNKLPKSLLFLATGSGIAPLIAMLYQLEQQKYKGEINLYFGLRNENEIFATDTLDCFVNNLKDFKYHVCLSKPNESWVGYRGRITNAYKIQNPKETFAYLCGNPNMIEENVSKLKGLGLNNLQIFYEKFTVAAQPSTN